MGTSGDKQGMKFGKKSVCNLVRNTFNNAKKYVCIAN